MKRAEQVCQILNRHQYLGYTDWRVHPNDHAQIYVVAGQDVQIVKTMYEAFAAAVDLEHDSGIKFGRDK